MGSGLEPAVYLPIKAVVAAVLVTTLQLVMMGSELTADADLIDLMASARDCAQGRGCDLRLYPGAPHGGGFTHFLALVFSLGGDVQHARIASAVVIGLSFGILFLVAVRLRGEPVAWLLLPAAFLPHLPYLAGGFSSIGVVTVPSSAMFWNPTLVAPFAMLFAAGACCYLERPRTIYLVLASLGAGLAPSFHLAAAILLPAPAVLALLSPKKNRTDALVSVLVPIAVAQLAFPTILLVHQSAFPGASLLTGPQTDLLFDRGGISIDGWFLVYVGVAALFVMSLAAPGSSGEKRTSIFFLVTHVPLLLLITLCDEGQNVRYGYALGPGLSLLLAVSLVRLARFARQRVLSSWSVSRASAHTLRVTVLGLAVAYLATLAMNRGEDDYSLTLSDTEAIASHLADVGWMLEDVVTGLRGNELVAETRMRQRITAYRHLLPGTRSIKDREDEVEVLILPVETVPTPLPDGWTVVRERRGYSIVVRRFMSVLRWERYTACHFYPDSDQDDCECVEVRRQPRHSHPVVERHRLSSKLRWRVRGTGMRPGSSSFLVVRVPMRHMPDLGPRRLKIPAAWSHYPCGGAILGLEGLDAEYVLPAAAALLAGPDREEGGFATIAWDLSSELCRNADTPLPLPTILDREPGLISVDMEEPGPHFRDPDILERLTSCVSNTADPLEPAEVWRRPAEPLVPGWYVLAVGVLIGMGCVVSAYSCVRVPVTSKSPR